MMTMREYRDSRKSAYAWPGGYPLFYILIDGASLCHRCGANNWQTIVRTWNTPRSGWRPVAVDVNWESALACDHCGDQIESAYPVVAEGAE